ncbi:MAG TPA: hypothetical protein DCG21_06670 [Gammaproteobacteria bacterium]|nr:hypothetical protein [Gammaproteobacteria bacterium]
MFHTSPRQALFCGKTRRSARRAVVLRKRARTLDCRRIVNFWALVPTGWAAQRNSGYPDYLVGMRELKVADKLNPQRISWLMAR